MHALAADILAVLPQTQCTRCGYPDCAAYAQAVADGTADINQCPPGGAQGIRWLAKLTGRPEKPVNPDHGAEGPRSVAFIDEDWCIGCTLCIKVCPTDAIVGRHKSMHTVMERYCTGCELCIPACPVDCIQLENASQTATGWSAWSLSQAKQARQRYELRGRRLKRELQENETRLKGKAPLPSTERPDPASPAVLTTPDKKKAAVEAALARARAKKEAAHKSH